MKLQNIDKVQRVAFVNAYRRGFWRGNYSMADNLEHIKSEVIEFGQGVMSGDKINQAEEGGDIILCTLTALHKLGIKGSDAIKAAISKELQKESGGALASQNQEV